jgi:hypothetical protein
MPTEDEIARLAAVLCRWMPMRRSALVTSAIVDCNNESYYDSLDCGGKEIYPNQAISSSPGRETVGEKKGESDRKYICSTATEMPIKQSRIGEGASWHSGCRAKVGTSPLIFHLTCKSLRSIRMFAKSRARPTDLFSSEKSDQHQQPVPWISHFPLSHQLYHLPVLGDELQVLLSIARLEWPWMPGANNKAGTETFAKVCNDTGGNAVPFIRSAVE